MVFISFIFCQNPKTPKPQNPKTPLEVEVNSFYKIKV